MRNGEKMETREAENRGPVKEFVPMKYRNLGQNGDNMGREEDPPRACMVNTNDNEMKREKVRFIQKTQPVFAEVGDVKMTVVLDSGAEVSLIGEDAVNKMKNVKIDRTVKTKITDVQSSHLEVIGVCVVPVKLREDGSRTDVGFHIIGRRSMKDTVIIGLPALSDMGMKMNQTKESDQSAEEVSDRNRECVHCHKTNHEAERCFFREVSFYAKMRRRGSQ